MLPYPTEIGIPSLKVEVGIRQEERDEIAKTNNEMKSAKTNEMKSNSWEQFPQESPLHSKDVGHLIACISSIAVATFMVLPQENIVGSLVQRPSDTLSHISNLCPLRIFGLHGFYVDPTQAKG